VVLTVTKIVFIRELVFHVGSYLAELNPSFVFDIKVKLHVGPAVTRVSDNELMKMRIGPTHDTLQDSVKFTEASVTRNLNSSPNWMPNAL
jgi:hypothetical protein